MSLATADFDNITAIATPYGKGSISVIRVSGSTCIQEVAKIFKGKDLTQVSGNTLVYGFILDKSSQPIDEVVVAVFRKPHSFTVDDMLEISCHGGVFVTNLVLNRLLSLNIRMANPGEFSYRAYLNGRIDLVKAEAVMDLIEADTKSAAKISINSLLNQTGKKISEFKDQVLALISDIEVKLQYPEFDEAKDLETQDLKNRIEQILLQLKFFLKNSKSTTMLKSGVSVAIVGRPNVGKSSLLNSLLKQEKDLVTDIKGTTRDIVEGKIVLNNIALNLLDTAGIHTSTDQIEELGIKKSLQAIDSADLVLFVFEAHTKLRKEDLDILAKIQSDKLIKIANKKDLGIFEKHGDAVYISTFETDLKALEDAILTKLKLTDIDTRDLAFLSNQRQIRLLEKAIFELTEALRSADFVTADLVVLNIKAAYSAIKEILGEVYDDDVNKNIFSHFCLGK